MNLVRTSFVDSSDLPFVAVNSFPATAQENAQWMADMEALINAGENFVLVYAPMPPMEEQKEDVEARKAVILWLKQNKDLFSKFCKGMVMTCSEGLADKPFLEQMQAPISKVYGVPIEIGDTAKDARAKALALVTHN